MYRIVLVNMPFANLTMPSLALSQIQSGLSRSLPGSVSVEVLYVNQDFARFTGRSFYEEITSSNDANNSGLGDWLFRQVAFPAEPDNSEVYFRRYYPRRDEQTLRFKRVIAETRAGLDAFLDRTIDRFGIAQADLVGLTSMFSQTVPSLAMARKLKDRNPAIVTVMGGANCESPMGEQLALHAEQMDFVFSGPALLSFPEFVRHQLDDQPAKCHAIQGVFSRQNVSAAPQPGRRALGQELDIDVEVPLDYDEFFEILGRNFPALRSSAKLFFETSRGCWWGARSHCTFCGLNGSTMAYRAMSPGKALSQISSMFRYADRCTEFHAVDNIMPENYPDEVFAKLETPPGVSLFYEVKASLSEEVLATLARARVTRVQPGIESLATSTLKLMKKGTSAFQNLALLKNCLRYGIRPDWNLLIGFPGETGDVYLKYVRDVPSLMHLPPPSGAFPVRFDRYSPYFVQRERYGLDLHPCDFYALTYPFGSESLDDLAYYFMDHNIGAGYIRELVEHLADVQSVVNAWRERWTFEGGRALEPQLFLRGEGRDATIYDSRGAESVEHRLDPVEHEVLEALSEMSSMPKLASRLSHLSEREREVALGGLIERGLVFEERGRLISLVLPNETRPWFGGWGHTAHAAGEREGRTESWAASEVAP